MGDSLMVGEDQRIPNNDNSENALENRTDRTGGPRAPPALREQLLSGVRCEKHHVLGTGMGIVAGDAPCGLARGKTRSTLLLRPMTGCKKG